MATITDDIGTYIAAQTSLTKGVDLFADLFPANKKTVYYITEENTEGTPPELLKARIVIAGRSESRSGVQTQMQEICVLLHDITGDLFTVYLLNKMSCESGPVLNPGDLKNRLIKGSKVYNYLAHFVTYYEER